MVFTLCLLILLSKLFSSLHISFLLLFLFFFFPFPLSSLLSQLCYSSSITFPLALSPPLFHTQASYAFSHQLCFYNELWALNPTALPWKGLFPAANVSWLRTHYISRQSKSHMYYSSELSVLLFSSTTQVTKTNISSLMPTVFPQKQDRALY